MKIGICAWKLPGEEIEAFRLASELGIEGVVIDYGVHNQEHPLLAVERAADFLDENPLFFEEGRKKYLDEARKYNIEIPTLALGLFCERGMTYYYLMEYAKDVISNAIDIAKEMGIPKIQIPSFHKNLIRTEQDLLNTIELFKYACRIGEKKDIIIGTENVLTIAQNKRLIEEVNSTHFTIMFDTQNPWRMANQDGARVAESLEPYTGELHAKDSILGLNKMVQLGEGDVRFNEIIKIYADKGYDGWIHLESNYSGDGYEDVIKEDINILKNIFK